MNKNDMYLYFETIHQIEPEKILDIGMFLKRIGAVSRQAMSESVDESILLDGIDFMADIKINVYKNVYNHQCPLGEFIRCVEKEDVPFGEGQYDLVFFLYPEKYLTEMQEIAVWTWLEAHAKYVIADCKDRQKYDKIKQKGKFRDIAIDEDVYGLITFG